MFLDLFFMFVGCKEQKGYCHIGNTWPTKKHRGRFYRFGRCCRLDRFGRFCQFVRFRRFSRLGRFGRLGQFVWSLAPVVNSSLVKSKPSSVK